VTFYPGDYLVTSTRGRFAGIIRKITHSGVNHAAVYVGSGQIVEAWTGGARLRPVSVWPDAIWSTVELTGAERLSIVRYARAMVGTPYNYKDIVAQFVVRVFRWNAPPWALDRLGRPDRLQCAQLVDLAYAAAGVSLFPDGRPFGLVAPSDLEGLIHAAP
jgi:uncharacterized protein YbjT (DUF2867 family)